MELTWADKLELKGAQRGAVQTARRSVLRVLTRRFGTLPNTLTERINLCTSLETLEALLDQAIDIRSLDELDWT